MKKNTEYAAPLTDAMEMEERDVLCSSGGTQDYDAGSWEW